MISTQGDKDNQYRLFFELNKVKKLKTINGYSIIIYVDFFNTYLHKKLFYLYFCRFHYYVLYFYVFFLYDSNSTTYF